MGWSFAAADAHDTVGRQRCRQQKQKRQRQQQRNRQQHRHNQMRHAPIRSLAIRKNARNQCGRRRRQRVRPRRSVTFRRRHEATTTTTTTTTTVMRHEGRCPGHAIRVQTIDPTSRSLANKNPPGGRREHAPEIRETRVPPSVAVASAAAEVFADRVFAALATIARKFCADPVSARGPETATKRRRRKKKKR
jgi:hypothetical protein